MVTPLRYSKKVLQYWSIKMGANLRTLINSYMIDPDVLNTQPIRVYFAQLFVPNFVGILVFLVCFYRNKPLRRGLVREWRAAVGFQPTTF